MNDAAMHRFLFSLIHPGYLRGYAGAIRLLVERGHSVHIALGRLEKDEGDIRLAQELAAEHPAVTFGVAPARRRTDPWRALAWLVRAFTDLARYVHPSYADAPALRDRVALKISNHVRTAKQIDPLTALLCLGAVRVLARASGERPLRRAMRVLGALERAIPTSRPIDRFVRQQAPDAVVVVPLVEVGSPQVELVKSAMRLGIPTAAAISSWDNLTNKGLLRVVPDRVIVWNDVQRREAVEMHGTPPEAVVTTGAQRFDEWFERRPATTPREFALKVGLDPDRGYLLYLCSSPFIAPDEVSFVTRWAEAIRASGDERLAGIGLLVRPHPQNAAQWRSADLSRLGNVAVWPRHGAQPDAGGARADFFDSLAHGALVVGINTSALIESAILGKSVFTVLAPEFERTQEGTLHFHYLLHENGGFLRLARSLEEHVDQLADALRTGGADAAQTRAFVESFVRPHGLDRPATPILADAFEELAALPRRRPARTGASTWAVRGLRLAAAAVSGILFAVDRVVRKVVSWVLTRDAAEPLARRLAARRRSRPRPDLPPKPPHELRRVPVEDSVEALAVEAELERLARAPALVAGPWERDLETELLYWIPFLRWAAERFEIRPERLTATTTGAASWYADVARGGDPVPDAACIDPRLLSQLCAGFWGGTEPPLVVFDRLRFARLPTPGRPPGLPDRYVLADPAPRPALPRAGAAVEATHMLGGAVPVVELDEVDPEGRTALVAHAELLVAPYGGDVLLGPLLGTPTVALYTELATTATPHHDVLYRAARSLGSLLTVAHAEQTELLASLLAGPGGPVAPILERARTRTG